MSRDAINKNNRIVVVVPVVARGTRKTELPSNVVLKAGEGGLTEESLAHGEQFRSIITARFTKPLGHLAPHSVTAIAAALNIASTCSVRLLALLLRQRATAAITSSSPQL
jgi:mRNA interferase MazF